MERRGPAGPGTFQSAEGSRLPKPVELLSAGLAFLSADVGEKRGPSHQHDPRDQRSQRRRGIPLARVGQKNELKACQEHISPQNQKKKEKDILHKNEDYLHGACLPQILITVMQN